MNKRHTQRIKTVENEGKGIKRVEEYVLSSRKRNMGLSSSSRSRFCGSVKRKGSISRVGGISLQDFGQDDQEIDYWESYLKLERGVMDMSDGFGSEIVVDDSTFENGGYTKLVNHLYPILVSGSASCINEISNTWEILIRNLDGYSEMNKSTLERYTKMFFGRLFLNITLDEGIKSYYSAMIYLLLTLIPNRPQIISSIRPFIIRRIIALLKDEDQLNNKREKAGNKARTKKKTGSRKRKINDNMNFSDSNSSDEDFYHEKENSFSGVEKIKAKPNIDVTNRFDFKLGSEFEGGEGIMGKSPNLQLKLINCLVFFCKNFDISSNLAVNGIESLNELLEGMSELLFYQEIIPHANGNTNNSELLNLRTIVSRMNDLSSFKSHELTNLMEHNNELSISKISTFGIILLFMNIGENRFTRFILKDGNIEVKFKTVKLELRHIEIVLYSFIILLRKLISLTLLIGVEHLPLVGPNQNNSGNKAQSQNSLNQSIFQLIKNIVFLFPELSHPNILFTINQLVEIQSQADQKVRKNTRKKKEKERSDESGLESESEYENESEPEFMKGTDNEVLVHFKNGVEVLEKLKKRISQMKTNEFYFIENEISTEVFGERPSGNEIFLNDPIVGFITSIYLLLSDKSETRQNIIEQLHSILIPSLVEISENKTSPKMILFDILKQSLFNDKESGLAGGRGIKEVNSFISFLSNFNIKYSPSLMYFFHFDETNGIKNPKKNTVSIFPFKYPQLLYRRIISVLPFMIYSSKPNYRIIAIDIIHNILQLPSCIELLSLFINEVEAKHSKECNPEKSVFDQSQSKQRMLFTDMYQLLVKESLEMSNSFPSSEKSHSCTEMADGDHHSNDISSNLEYKNDKLTNNSSKRNSSARQSIEWSGVALDSHRSISNHPGTLNFAQAEMATQLYGLIVLLIERSRDSSPNVRIKSISAISSIVNSIHNVIGCELSPNEEKELNNSDLYSKRDDHIKILLGNFEFQNTKSPLSLLPIMDLIMECISDEKAICRKGSLILWDSLFTIIKSRKIGISSLKKQLLILFKKTLTDTSILVKRHSLQSLYSLFNYSPELKWVSSLWINYGLPTIIDSENFLVDKITEICNSMLTEQMKKLTKFITNFQSETDNIEDINDYINNIDPEFLFSWISLISQKENQIQTLSLYRISIKSIFKKYPLILHPLVEFLNLFIDFFIDLLNHNKSSKAHCNYEQGGKETKFKFPDLPFILVEELYIYLNQNNLSEESFYRDNISILTQKIHQILTELVSNSRKRKLQLIHVIPENNIMLISNSLFETFKLFITTFFLRRQDKSKLISLYQKVIFQEPEFFSLLTNILISTDNYHNHLGCTDLGLESNLSKNLVSFSLSSVIYILYLWDELNSSRNKEKPRGKNKPVIDRDSPGIDAKLEVILNSKLKGCIIPECNENYQPTCIERIYIYSLSSLADQINRINHPNDDPKVQQSEITNIRILGELFLLNYTLSSLNSNNSPDHHSQFVIPIIQTNNIQVLVPFIEDLFKYFKLKYIDNSEPENKSIILSFLGILVTTLGQACYSSSNIAKRIILNYLVPELQDTNSSSSPVTVKNNILIILHDLYILHTTLVDPHLSLILNNLVAKRNQLHVGNDRIDTDSDKDKTLILRKQTLLLISDLVGQGYIKLRGSYLLKFLHTLVDRNQTIRNISHGVFERILIKTNTSILVQNFVEILCYLNGWTNHPSIKSWNITDNSEINQEEKEYILGFIFNHLSDKQKHETIARIVHDFLALFIDQCNITSLPDSYDSCDGKTLQNALELLYSPELCIYHKYSKRLAGNHSSKLTSKLEMGPQTNYLCDDENLNAVNDEIRSTNFSSSNSNSNINSNNNPSNVLKELIQASLAIDIIPTLLSLKHLMKQSCSPFIKDLHKCIGELLKDYKNNLAQIIQDSTLIKELEYDFKMGFI
ncbi:condensin-2 complex subunit D3 [Cryptosporidium felis]|nr:condensin-2 complex subunit D3 [Cryptosporidium felis]